MGELSSSHLYWPRVFDVKTDYADWMTCSNKIGLCLLSNDLRCLQTIQGDIITPSKIDAYPWIFERKNNEEIIDVLSTFDSHIVDLRSEDMIFVLKHLKNSKFDDCKIDSKNIVELCEVNRTKIQMLKNGEKLCLLEFILG